MKTVRSHSILAHADARWHEDLTRAILNAEAYVACRMLMAFIVKAPC